MQSMQRGTAPFVLQANMIIVDVEVNGHPTQFILDTGAATTLLIKALADRLGLREAERTAGVGAGGTVRFSVVRVESIRVAGVTQRGLACPVADIPEVRTHVGENVEGILGFDFFGAGALHVDYRARQVTLERPAEGTPEMKVAVVDRTVRLLRFGIEFTLPVAGWSATLDTPLPTTLVVAKGPGGAEISVSETIAQGLSFEALKAAVEASATVQVADFTRRDARELTRAGKPAYRLRFSGRADGERRQFISEAILFDSGLLYLTCEAPEVSFAGSSSDVEAVFSSIRRTDPESLT